MSSGVWSESKVGYLADYFNGYAFKPEDWASEGLPIIRIQNISDPDAPANRFDGNINERRYLIRPGDILVSWSASLAAHVWQGPENAWLNQHIFKVVPHEDVVRRDYYPWLAEWFLTEMDRERHGSTMTHLTWGAFSSFRVPLPDLPTQATLAAYLDSETARIDSLIDRKRRFIDLLVEKRNALITRAVAKGLCPSAEIRDSGYAWFGDITATWPAVRLGYFAQVINGSTPSRAEPAYWIDGTVPWMSSGKVNEDRITEPSESITEKALFECGLRLVPPGSVLIGLVGQGRTRGSVAILDVGAAINQNVAAIIPGCRLNGRFLQYALASMYRVIREYGRGGNQAALNCQLVADLRLPLPPVEEQTEIAVFLDKTTDEIDDLIHRTEASIDLLREYRTALISAAVTGQIDIPVTETTEEVA